jgi:[ribosomal protein S5]-alanine N-acetyltransferase
LQFLETPRLFVRHFVPEDAEALFRVHSNPQVAQHMRDGKPLTYERCVKWIETSMHNYQIKGFGASAVIEKSIDKLIGCCGLVYDPERSEPEIPEVIYSFEPCCWGKGFASEIVPAMLTYGLTQCGLQRILATIAPENLASQRVVEKAGMVFDREEIESDGLPSRFYVIEANSIERSSFF